MHKKHVVVVAFIASLSPEWHTQASNRTRIIKGIRVYVLHTLELHHSMNVCKRPDLILWFAIIS